MGHSSSGVSLLLIFLLCSPVVLQLLIGSEEETGAGTSRKRRNYCYRNRLLGENLYRQRHPFGVGHVLSKVYNRISNANNSPCQPIHVSFFPIHSRSSELTEELVSVGEQHQPIIRFQLSVSNPLRHNSSQEHLQLRKFFFRRSQSCYFFLIQAPQNNTQLQDARHRIPLEINRIFRPILGQAWFSSSYFALANLGGSSVLGVAEWNTFRNKLELVCVENQGRERLLLQTICSACTAIKKLMLLQGVDPHTGKVQSYTKEWNEFFPNFIKSGLVTNWVVRSLRYRQPANVARTRSLMEHLMPQTRLFEEIKILLNSKPNTVISAWINGKSRSGLRNYVDEIESGGPFTLGLQFSSFSSKMSSGISFTFPYTQLRLALLDKREPRVSKWQILFEEVESTFVPLTVPTIVVTGLIIAVFTKRPRVSRTRKQSLVERQWDWMVYLMAIFHSQQQPPSSRSGTARLSRLVIFLVGLVGNLYIGFMRVDIATDLTTQFDGKVIQSIYQLDPSRVSNQENLWKGGRLDTNDEISRLILFQNAQEAEKQKNDKSPQELANLQYFYEPISCVNNIFTEERYICLAFEEYIQVMLPTLPVYLRNKLTSKIVDDLTTIDWLSVAFNKDFPYGQELTMFVLHLVESGIYDFWKANLSLAIPEADLPEEEAEDEEDFDSYQVQHEGLQHLVDHFWRGICALFISFIVELGMFVIKKYVKGKRLVSIMRCRLYILFYSAHARLRRPSFLW